MFPLYDDVPTRRPAVVVWLVIIACAAVFLWQIGLPARAQRDIVYGYGVIPAVLLGEIDLPRRLHRVPAWTTMLTSQFLHGGWLHLGGNMLYLWIFGSKVEDAMSRPRFLLFYLVCGVAAALAQSLVAPQSQVPMVGASGAIAGVLGAYVLLYPRANVTLLVIFVVFIRLVRLPAVLVLGFWFIVQLADGATTPTEQGGVAFMAHVGGFLAGMVLVGVFKDRGVGLFGHAASRSFTISRLGSARAGSVPDSGIAARRRSRPSPWL